MERCIECALPLNLVKHNERNLCVYCQAHKNREPVNWNERQKDFHSIIESFKGRGKKYDFIVPLTGGKDSTYVLYYITRVLGAKRVLAFTWDHLFHRQGSWTNMEKAIAASGVDFYAYRIFDIETTRAIHRGSFRAFGHTCMLCYSLQPAIIMNQAIRNEVPLIISGANFGQSQIRGTHDKPGPRHPGKEAAERIGSMSYVIRKAVKREMPGRVDEIEEEIIGGIKRGLGKPDFSWPLYLDMGTFMNWYSIDESAFLKTLFDAFGFQKPSDTFTRTSCLLERLRGYQEFNVGKVNKTGYTAEMSHFIREGVLTRTEALAQLERLGMTKSLPEEAPGYVTEIGLTMEEFREKIKSPLPLSVRAYFGAVAAGQAVKRVLSTTGKNKTNLRP